MGIFVERSGDIGEEVQSYILAALGGHQQGSVVSVVPIVRTIHASMPECGLSSRRLAKLVSEAAMLLGFIPVTNPAFKDDESGDGAAFGYRLAQAAASRQSRLTPGDSK